MRKSIFQIFSLALVIFALGALSPAWSFTVPTANPANNNSEAPVNVSADGQARRGALAIGKTSNPTGSFLLDVTGNIRAKGLSVFGAMDVSGGISADSLKSSLSEALCADATGVIAICSSMPPPGTFTLIDESTPGTYTVTIPAGVSSITVEIWGAGGAGYHYINNGGSGSNGCGGTGHLFTSTGSTFTGTGVQMTAGAGKCGYKNGSNYVGGAGGVASVTGGTGVVMTNGGTGGNGSNGGAKIGPTACMNTAWEMVRGGNGGMGGAGGSAPNGGNGGTAGVGGLSRTSSGFEDNVDQCQNEPSPYIDTENYIAGTKGGNGTNGAFPGGGGAGAGGLGGGSHIDPTGTTCTAGSYVCDGQKGFPGGGAGAYAKATFSGISGQTFTYTVGKAYRNDTMYVCEKSNYTGTCDKTETSGWGANGRVKVIYQ